MKIQDNSPTLEVHPENQFESDLNPSMCSSVVSKSSTLVWEPTDPSFFLFKIESPKKTKRKKKRIENWRRNIQKTNRNRGEAYTSSRGLPKPAKKMGPACKSTCGLKCSQNVSDDQRNGIFQNFWQSGDLMAQRNFVSKHLETSSILQTKRNKRTKSKKRQLSNKFFLPIKTDRVRVCKVFFVNTLAISNRWIRTVNTKERDGFLEEDFRGKHGQQRKLDPEIHASVRAHINSIPRIESHYCRANTSREFIENSKSVADIHRDYKLSREEAGLPAATYNTFNNIFKDEFNLSFFKRKKDLCNLCESYTNGSEEEKALLQEALDIHHREKELIREMKEKDKQDPSIIAACFDLEAVLSAPLCEVNAFYYVSKIATYNFTLYELQSKQGFCFVWNESDGMRGANEIGSCLWRYLTQIQSGKPVVLYADNCFGQNKNKYITSLLMYAVQVLDIPSIHLHFFVVGHSQNENDHMHSLVEKQKKRALAAGPIYVPAQWIPIIAAAKKSGQPFKIEEMDFSDFIDVKNISLQMGKNYNKTVKKTKVLWTEIRSLRVLKGEPDRFSVKESFEDGEEYKEIIVSKHVDPNTIEIKQLFSKPLIIRGAKLAGLLELCKKNLILKKYHSFYNNLKLRELELESEAPGASKKRKKNGNGRTAVKRRKRNNDFIEEDS
jgi:hypothetical protein